MMNGISSLGRMPGMDQMQQMKAKAFATADADGSGGLGKAEFENLLKNSPMSKMGGGPDATQAFGRIDGDGDGTVTQAELNRGMEQMLQSMQSTMQAFGNAGASGPGSAKQDTLQTLLAALEAGSAQRGAERTDGGSTRELLQRLADQLQNSYGTMTAEATRREPLLSVAA